MQPGRKIYFGAGPAALPETVLKDFSEAVLDYKNNGISILSLAHREPAFEAILEESKTLVLELCNFSASEYEVLWLQGGGRHQFSMIPMNFLGEGMSAGFVDSGFWAHNAMEAAAFYGNAVCLSSSKEASYRHLPKWPAEIPEDLRYVHFTTNNTIYGTQWPEIPACRVPLIADMSSDIFSAERNYANCDLIYAVAQKNFGPAGVTLVVVRKEMLEKQVRKLPEVFSYKAQANADSILNTPPVATIYACLLMLRWTKAQGIKNIEADNQKKAALLYEEIDQNPLFVCPVEHGSRSSMNVVFTMNDPAQEKSFLEFCATRNIDGIKGHRKVGGFRASLYNAVTKDDVNALVSAMQEFVTK